jgi:hypothetical protein
VGNVGVNQKSLGRAGSKCWLGKCPVVRGVVMNPVDHHWMPCAASSVVLRSVIGLELLKLKKTSKTSMLATTLSRYKWIPGSVSGND